MTRILLLAAVGLILPGVLPAQSVQLRAVLQDGRFQDLSAGSVIEFPAASVRQEVRAQVQLTYTGSKSLTVSRVDLLGSSDFSIVTSTTGSVTLKPFESTSINIRYFASSSARTLGQLSVVFGETDGTPSSVRLNLAGTAPEFAVQYALQTDNNARVVENSGRISFPASLVEVASAASVFIINQGSGNGSLQGTRLVGDTFELRDLPLLPSVIEPGKNARFTVRATPRQPGVVTGALTVLTTAGELRFDLEAAARLSNLEFQVMSGEGQAILLPGGTISFPQTAIGGRSTVTVRVRNEQNANIPVSDISTAAPFTVVNAPLLPKVFAPGETLDLIIEFLPTLTRTYSGRLKIGADQFNLSGPGIGPSLLFFAITGSETSKVEANGSVVFRPSPIGKQSVATVVVRNEGTGPAVLDTIAITDSRGRFTASGLPSLPQVVEPNGEVSMVLNFSPAAEGSAVAGLVINSYSFTLRGTGLPAPPLPTVQITVPAQLADVQQQLQVGVSLSNPYELDLVGTLTISAEASGVSLDPFVQFSTGGRTATFRVPSGTTRAVFTNGLDTIRMQSGSIAGTLVITSTLATAAKTDLTPVDPPAVRITIARSVPRLVHAVMDVAQDNSFTLRVAGVAPGRTLSRMKCQFVPTGAVRLPADRAEFDLTMVASSWFRSSQSVEFGGTFGISVPLRMNLSGADPKSPPGVRDVLQAMLCTVEDETGTSSAIRAEFE